jgi:hypothetical protein
MNESQSMMLKDDGIINNQEGIFGLDSLFEDLNNYNNEDEHSSQNYLKEGLHFFFLRNNYY